MKTLAILTILITLTWALSRGKEASSLELAPSSSGAGSILMNVSAYCAGSCCCGKFADGLTASGVPAKGLICAAPPEYPFGTKMAVAGVVYAVEDRGSAITGNKLDLLMESHEKALEFGRQMIMVTLLEN